MASRKRPANGLVNDAAHTADVPPTLLKQMRTIQKRAKKRAPGRPTSDQSEELRTSLINAAMRAFMEDGFEGSSIEAIGRDAKIAKITIYRQFGDKASLFRAVAHYALESLRSRLANFSDFSDSPGIGLRKLIQRLYEANTQPDFLAVERMVIAEATRFPEVALVMLDEAYYGLEPAIDYLEKLKREGHIVVDSPRHAVLQLMALAVGGTRPLLRDPATDPINRQRWVESVYLTFARAWGLEPVPRAKPAPAATTPAAKKTVSKVRKTTA